MSAGVRLIWGWELGSQGVARQHRRNGLLPVRVGEISFSVDRIVQSTTSDSAPPMPADPDTSPLDQIMTLAREIVDDCPSCAGKATQIAMWAREIRERRPSRQELEALVDATCKEIGRASCRERV